MSPTRLRECLAALRWSQRGLAGELGCDERVVRRWAAGQAPIPDAVAAWLEKWASFATAHPRPGPEEWRQTRVVGAAAERVAG